MRRRLPWVVLALALVLSAGLHAYHAANPTAYQSSDERSYGTLGWTIAEGGKYGTPTMVDPLHWPPGYPLMLAAGQKLAPSADVDTSRDIAAGYWLQALVALLTVGVVFLLVRLLTGQLWPAVAAAVLLALYPAAILQTGEQVSEPLGALMLSLFALALALVWAARTRSPWWYAAAGALLGGVILVRTDYLFLPAVMALFVAATFLLRRPRVGAGGVTPARRARDWRRALLAGGALGLGAAVAITPWTIYASGEAGQLVPVTRGGGPALFVGTYLPGGGNTVGLKRHVGAEVKRAKPELRKYSDFDLPAIEVLNYIARKERPGMKRNDALQAEGKQNLVEYGLGDPIDFGAMMANKAWRMWSKYSRGGARHTSPVYRGWHILLVSLCFVGLFLGVWRRRSSLLAAFALVILYATALHTIVVGHARYNYPLMPLVIAGGVAGWWLWWRARVGASEAAGAAGADASPGGGAKEPALSTAGK